MNFRLSAFLIGACLFTQLQAQDAQYIVKLNGDTLRGKLQINPLQDNSLSMFFKGDDGSKSTIRPLRISFVYYDEDHQFRSVPFYNNRRLFMQIIKEDEHLSYYNYIHKRDNSIATTKVIVKPNGKVLELSALTFKKQLTEFLDDCPEIVSGLEAKKYRYKNHAQLFADYNDCDQKTVLISSTPTTVSTEAVVVASNVHTDKTEIPIADANREKLSKIEAFRTYVESLDDFTYSSDVLEWLSDVENRIIQNRDIPNYLWSSLNAMTKEPAELQEKAETLQNDLEN